MTKTTVMSANSTSKPLAANKKIKKRAKKPQEPNKTDSDPGRCRNKANADTPFCNKHCKGLECRGCGEILPIYKVLGTCSG